MFKYKTKTELDALTDDQLSAYMAEKKTYEDGLQAKAIQDAVDAAKKEAKADAEAEIKKAVETAKAEAKKITDDLAQTIGELKEQSGKDDAKKGVYGEVVSFLKKNIEENPKAESDQKYAARTVVKAAALMTTANVIPNVAGGFSPLVGNYIDPEIGHLPVPDTIFMGLVTKKTAPGTDAIWYSDRINEEGNAQFIAEGGLKPLIDAEWKTVKKNIFEVAERWKQSKRLILHAPSVVADFVEHANNLIEQKIDDEILVGVEDATNFNGLQEVGGAFIVPAGLAGYYTYANIWDVVMAMATQVRLAYFKGPLTAVLNTVWMAKMAGIKDQEGRYVIPPFVTPDGRRIGEVTIVFSTKIAAGDIIVGDLKKYNLVMSEDVMYDEGYENDDFSKNLVSKKLEAYLGSYMKASDAGAIIYDQIATVLTAISAA
jgi:HK97 family phage major capsid protein